MLVKFLQAQGFCLSFSIWGLVFYFWTSIYVSVFRIYFKGLEFPVSKRNQSLDFKFYFLFKASGLGSRTSVTIAAIALIPVVTSAKDNHFLYKNHKF